MGPEALAEARLRSHTGSAQPASLRRFHLCQTGAGSQGARDFILGQYAAIKADNPSLPFLIREAEGVRARLIGRYGEGWEKGWGRGARCAASRGCWESMWEAAAGVRGREGLAEERAHGPVPPVPSPTLDSCP